ncbi:DUF4439 domain-containing protein, partial [Actinotalea sp.]|uniref:DUF4439 domain-containing protein n=1 Tax=Actinotalea sp. TaxID=1872145 RepID=UPI003568DA06
ETPAPTTPAPGAAETARQDAVADALAIAELATAAAADPGSAALAERPELAEVLLAVAATSSRHAEELGGVYTPWTATPTPAPDTSTSSPTTSAPTPGAQDVIDALEQARQRAADDADEAEDGGFARLLASIAASRSVLAADLEARLAGTTLALPTTEEATSGTSADAGPTSSGVQDSALLGLVEAHDALGAAWEVLAARAEDDERARAALVASEHRSTAQALAAALGAAGTDLDPRRTAYALPAELLDPEGDALAGLLPLETRLGVRLAGLVAQADPGSRAALVSALEENAHLLLVLTGAPQALPGVDEDAAPDATSDQPADAGTTTSP